MTNVQGGEGCAAEPGVEDLQRFHHEALLYAGDGQFVAGAAAFVREGLNAGEPVMVMVGEPRAQLLRAELGAAADAVHFLDLAQVGRNPARIIPTWQAWVDRNRSARGSLRGVGEPLWAGRTAAEIREWQLHVALLSVAFGAGDDVGADASVDTDVIVDAAPGAAWRLLSTYDTAALGGDVISQITRSHPTLLDQAGTRRPSPDYRHSEAAVEELPADPLPEPTTKPYETQFDRRDLVWMRQVVSDRAKLAGLAPARAKDLVLAMNELVCNGIQHGGGDGVLRLWEEAGALVGEVRNRGTIQDPLVGRRQPPASAQGGAGLWIVNQVCDLVQIRSSESDGVVVRVWMALPAADEGVQGKPGNL
jgi:anti-sigma regulatory factor (Ser/Thr protein kinase)